MVIRHISGRPIFWQDANGIVHRCEGDDVHPGIRLIWTLCKRDVPACASWTNGDHDPIRVTCKICEAAT